MRKTTKLKCDASMRWPHLNANFLHKFSDCSVDYGCTRLSGTADLFPRYRFIDVDWRGVLTGFQWPCSWTRRTESLDKRQRFKKGTTVDYVEHYSSGERAKT